MVAIDVHALLAVLYLEPMLFRGAYWLSRGLLSSGVRRETSPLIHYCSSELVYNIYIVSMDYTIYDNIDSISLYHR